MARGSYVNTNAETITSSFTTIELSADAAMSSVGPYGDYFDISGTPATSPTQITYYFSADAAGEVWLSSQAVMLLPAGKGTTVGGGHAIDVTLALRGAGRSGTLYLQAKTDAGTLALTALTGCVVQTCDSRGGM